MTQSASKHLIERIRALSQPLQPRPTGLAPKLDPLPEIRALLFDVYGTLVISASGDIGLSGEQDASRAFAEALDAAGLRAPAGAGPGSLERAIRAFHAESKAAGIDFPEVEIRQIWRQVLDTQEVEGLAVEYECRVNPVWPMPGLTEVLTELRERGLVMGIVSNAQFYTELMLEAFLHAPLAALGFDSHCCAWSYRLLEAKPSPRIYQAALDGLRRRYGIAPGEVLYVGNDMRNDIWPASLSGCRTALFAGDARSLRLRTEDPHCAGIAPDSIVTELRQITEHLLPPDWT